MNTPTIQTEINDTILIVSINRPEFRNAIDIGTAELLAQTFRDFDQNPQLHVAILTGVGEHFCAGADLKAVASGRGNRLSSQGDGPLGPTRLNLSKPVIAAIEGFAVAGGLELALWCDLRVAGSDARFGVFCRRWGVPLIDGGTVRLPRLIGQSRAMDMILTGREVAADEAQQFGLVNRLCPAGQARATALQLARSIAAFPQTCLRADRQSALAQWSRPESLALQHEFSGGMAVIESGETLSGAQQFTQSKRHPGTKTNAS